jgi:hypothetical protein
VQCWSKKAPGTLGQGAGLGGIRQVVLSGRRRYFCGASILIKWVCVCVVFALE